jgi:hypothetical protein
MSKSYVTIGELKKGENGDLYFQFNKQLKIKINGEDFAGKSVWVNDPAKKYELAVENGNLTPEQAEEKIAKIPDYIRKEFVTKI